MELNLNSSMLTLLPNEWTFDGQAHSNSWTFIFVKKCPELLIQICNHMAEPDKESGIHQNEKQVKFYKPYYSHI